MQLDLGRPSFTFTSTPDAHSGHGLCGRPLNFETAKSIAGFLSPNLEKEGALIPERDLRSRSDQEQVERRASECSSILTASEESESESAVGEAECCIRFGFPPHHLPPSHHSSIHPYYPSSPSLSLTIKRVRILFLESAKGVYGKRRSSREEEENNNLLGPDSNRRAVRRLPAGDGLITRATSSHVSTRY